MKKTYLVITVLLLTFTQTVQSQFLIESAGVTAQIVPANPQGGSYNYFGVLVSIPRIYDQNITVEGFIWENPAYKTPYSLTITAGNTFDQTALNFFATGPADEPTGLSITKVTPDFVTASSTAVRYWAPVTSLLLDYDYGTSSGLTAIMNEFYDSSLIDVPNLKAQLKLPSTFSKSDFDFVNLQRLKVSGNDTVEVFLAAFNGNNGDSSIYFSIYRDLDFKCYGPKIVKTKGTEIQELDMYTGKIASVADYTAGPSISISYSTGNYLSVNRAPLSCADLVAECLAEAADFRKHLVRSLIFTIGASGGNGVGILFYAAACYVKNCRGGEDGPMAREYYNHLIH